MIVSKLLTIPKGTTEPTVLFSFQVPEETLLYKVYIDIPYGWEYSAGIQILLNRSTSIPDFISNSEETSDNFLTGNDSFYELPVLKMIPNKGYIEIIGVNNDPNNDHSCAVVLVFSTKDELKMNENFGGVD